MTAAGLIRRLPASIVAAMAIALAMALRLWPVLSGQLAWHPDEFNYVYWPLLFLVGDLNPDFYYYPLFHHYIITAALGLVWGITWLLGSGQNLLAFASHHYFWDADAALMVGRLVSVGFAGGSVWLTWLIGREAYGPRAGALAAFLLAISVVHVRQSVLASADVAMGFWYLFSTWVALRAISRPGLWRYLGAGALVGLCAASKYNGGAALGSVLMAWMYTRQWRQWVHLVLAVAVAGVTFLVVSPHLVVEHEAAVQGLSRLWSHVAGPGGGSGGWFYHVHTSLYHGLGAPGLALTLLALPLALRSRDRRQRVIAGTFLAYFACLGFASVGYVRYAMPLLVLQAVLAAGVLSSLLWSRAGILALLLLAAPSLAESGRATWLMARSDTRSQARTWMEAHVPSGSRCCNFGGWMGDPQVRTFEDLWFRIRHFVRNSGEDTFRQAQLELHETYPEFPVYRYMVQAHTRKHEAGSLNSARLLGCEYAVVNRHRQTRPGPSPTLARDLAQGGRRLARFAASADAASEKRVAYDPQDAFYVPLGGNWHVDRLGPEVEIWQLGEREPAAAGLPTAEHVLAGGLMAGARGYLVQGGYDEFLALAVRALALDPQQSTAEYHHLAGIAHLGLGDRPAAAREWLLSVAMDPDHRKADIMNEFIGEWGP